MLLSLNIFQPPSQLIPKLQAALDCGAAPSSSVPPSAPLPAPAVPWPRRGSSSQAPRRSRVPHPCASHAAASSGTGPGSWAWWPGAERASLGKITDWSLVRNKGLDPEVSTGWFICSWCSSATGEAQVSAKVGRLPSGVVLSIPLQVQKPGPMMMMVVMMMTTTTMTRMMLMLMTMILCLFWGAGS